MPGRLAPLNLHRERPAVHSFPAPVTLTLTATFSNVIYDSTYIDAPILRDRDTDDDGVISAAGGDERLYYLHDANWNTTALVDGTAGSATEGEVVERYAYDAYGRPAVYNASWIARPAGSAYDNPIQFAGYHFDAETGLMLARHRFYNSSLGTWENRDPIGYGDGMNVVAYVGGNPVGEIDPSGNQAVPSPNWHHLASQAIFRGTDGNPSLISKFGMRLVGANIDSAKYGWIIVDSLHTGEGGLHPLWNKELLKWVQELNESGVKEITGEMLDAKIATMKVQFGLVTRNGTAIVGKEAEVAYGGWKGYLSKLRAAGKYEEYAAKLIPSASAKKSLLSLVAKLGKKLGVGLFKAVAFAGTVSTIIDIVEFANALTRYLLIEYSGAFEAGADGQSAESMNTLEIMMAALLAKEEPAPPPPHLYATAKDALIESRGDLQMIGLGRIIDNSYLRSNGFESFEFFRDVAGNRFKVPVKLVGGVRKYAQGRYLQTNE